MMNGMLTYFRSHMGRLTALLASVIAFIIYLATADSGVSYWDCPEYVLTASSLQIGHPPGNPIWTLAMRVATIPFPAALHAKVINICSGFLMALAVFFLARIIYRMVWFFLTRKSINHFQPLSSLASTESCAAITSFFASLCFAVLDSTWYSAVEAEVYAFSTFLSAFTIWLMLKWAESADQAARSRWLVLTAYMIGLSLGVHQLNLLVLPVLALIFVFRRNPGTNVTLKAWMAIGASFILVAVILLGLMPGSIEWCAALELLCVNGLGAPYFSGVLLYPSLMCAMALLTIILTPRVNTITNVILFSGLFFISGLFLFGQHFFIALLLSILTSGFLVAKLSRRGLLTSAWMLIMVWTGYSAIALILIRGYAAPPVNEGNPADIFSMQRYISREQYGSKPLFYGPTPFSRPMFEETVNPTTGEATYSRYALRKEQPRYMPALQLPRLIYRSRQLSHSDSVENLATAEKNHGYLLADYKFSRRMTPELDMWLPRITSGSRNMLDSYADWAGMTDDNMKRVAITTAYDSAGHAVGKLLPSGERDTVYSYRPTYLQNLRFFLSYQTYYMYLRYLLWNFVGRQNDIPATGEIDHGNVLTGINPLDRLMTGDERLMPQEAAYDNPGRHAYYAIPFLIGIAGIILLLKGGRRGKRLMAVVTMLFLMTGVAIVVYLNQNPGEPRERDYAFIASYMAFCIWIGFGLLAIGRLFRRLFRSRRTMLPAMATCGAILFFWYLIENYPDHNRSGRFHTRAFALNMLKGKERDIIFSYGDNFTFPLWYAQEVEGAAPEATVADLSYLATPEYVLNLMRQGNKGLKLTATPSDIAYGAYAFTRISPDADTVPLPLIDALRSLYSSRETSPAFQHSRAIIPGRTLADSIVINLRSLATVSGMIPFRTLMLLDILATNLDQPEPRPMSFLNSVKNEVLMPVKEALRAEAFSDTYAPFMEREEYLQRINLSASEIDSTAGSHRGQKIYADPVIDDQIRRQRGALVRVARQYAVEEKDTATALRLLTDYTDLYPGTSPGSYAVADTAFHETLTAADLLIRIGNGSDVEKALELLRRSHSEASAWRRYYSALPSWRRHTVSNDSRRLITTIPLIDSLTAKGNERLNDNSANN